MVIFDFLKLKTGTPRGYLSAYDRETISAKWKNVEQLLAAQSPSSRREAVLEADKILDYALDRLYPNQTSTGERLKLAKEIFVNKRKEYDDLWFAHKVRNEMVHNLNFEMPAVETLSTVEKFKTGLISLGAIL